MKEAIFLDRDGVLVENKEFISKKEDVIIFPNVINSLKKLKEKSYLLIVVTNQSAVAKGFITEKNVKEINNYLNKRLENLIDKFYYCPHYPEICEDIPEYAKKYRVECECRKPLPGMLLKAAREFEIDLKRSYMIGDMITDIVAGKSVQCKTIMVESPNNNKIIQSHVKIDINTKADYYCRDLSEAVNIILKESLNKKIYFK